MWRPVQWTSTRWDDYKPPNHPTPVGAALPFDQTNLPASTATAFVSQRQCSAAPFLTTLFPLPGTSRHAGPKIKADTPPYCGGALLRRRFSDPCLQGMRVHETRTRRAPHRTQPNRYCVGSRTPTPGSVTTGWGYKPRRSAARPSLGSVILNGPPHHKRMASW